MRAGKIAAAIMNSQGGWGENKPAQPWDFFPALRPKQSPEEVLAAFLWMGAKDMREH